MELIFLWTEEFRNVYKSGFNFSPNYKVNFSQGIDGRIINIKTKQTTENFFGERVQQITALIGKNGSGKTNILDLLGAKRYDRQNFKSLSRPSYFIVYHHEENKFVIEGNDFELIKKSIHFPTSEIDLIKEPYSFVVELNNGKLKYKGFLQFIDEYIEKINYINFRHQYSESFFDRHNMKVENEYSHLFNRVNMKFENTGHSAIYQMIHGLINKDIKRDTFLFEFKNNPYLEIELNLYTNDGIDLHLKEGFEKNIYIPLLSKKKKFTLDNKNAFINKFLYQYCHLLASHIFLLPENEKQLSKFINESIQSVNIHKDEYQNYYFEIINLLLNYKTSVDKYFGYKDQIIHTLKEYTSIISKLDQEWFRENKIVISFNEGYSSITNDLLLRIDDLNFFDDELQSLLKVYSVKFQPFSAGEKALMSLFAALYYAITLNYNREKEKAIILLDEPDSFLHPEWSRRLIDELIAFLERIENGYSKYQLILTTHSPFIISDLPKENVIALDKDPFSGKCIKVPIDNSFAANIHTLLAKDFFMESTTGEFSKKKINCIIKLLIESEELTATQKQEVDYIISIIGEPLLKNKLEEMVLKFQSTEEKIKRLKAMILELEKYDIDK